MKNILLPVFILITLTFGCKKAEELTQFDIDYSSEVTIPSSTGISLPFDLFTPDVETNSESKFAINDTRKDKIEFISLKKLQLVIKSPSGADFSFLESIEIFINANGLSEKRVAWKENISPSAGSDLSLDVSEINLQEYILKDEFSLRVQTVTDEVITQDHVLEINSTFFVDAKLL